MKYKNLIFDVGGVLLSYRWMELIMETIIDRDEAERFANRLFNDPLWLEFDVELRPFDDVVEDYVRKYPEDEEHIRYVLGHLERMPLSRERVWERIHELKKAGYRIYLLSNYSSRMFHIHTDGLPFLDDLDGHIISYEVHRLKPDKEIYEALFERYSLNPGECIFFDDRQENVDGGRKCGMEGRVIYSEETLLGYLERLLAPDHISNPFHDSSKPREERIDWLLSHMTTEEKVIMYSHPEQGAGRFGVEGFVIGGEAAHGIEARNDQNGIGEKDITTSFPNPVGMSSSWDKKLIFEAGRITGTEARALFRRHRKTGLARWAPTIDLERDPRWGRNEEGYGEDPCLVSGNAGAFISGMQGEDPDYIRCGTALKHYYANNSEKDRFFSNSSIGLRDKFEYYLVPFKHAVEKAGALGIMTAYNRINGIPGMTDPEIRSLFKEKNRLQYAVTDGFAMMRLMNYHHEYGTIAECLAESVKAGIDLMNDTPEKVEKALRDALELALISEDDLDNVLRNILMTGMRLGIYDSEGCCPYDKIRADETDTEEARNICRKISEESVVLLENRDHALPLNKESEKEVLVAGPLADKWLGDWYGGIPPFAHSVYEGISSLTGTPAEVVMGLDKYRILAGDRAWHIEEDDSISLSDPDEGDLFYIENWGEGYYTIKSAATGKYIQSSFYGKADADRGKLTADKEDVFDWFTTCRFYIDGDIQEGEHTVQDRFLKPLTVAGNGKVKADSEIPAIKVHFEKIMDGIEEAKAAAKGHDTIILVLGCNPMIPAREDYDRTSLALPDTQQRLLDAFTGSEKKVIAVLLSNYPYTMNGAEKKIDAVLLSATGSEYMGDAVAAVLFGEASPAGRIVQGWPALEGMLPDMDDYRITGLRSYRYVSKGWLYPFGYGLTYEETACSDLQIEDTDTEQLLVNLSVENKGQTVSDEVVQIYATAEFDDEKFSGYGYGRRLIGYERIRGLQPGESRRITIAVGGECLQVYDVVKRDYILYEGDYRIYAGRHAFDEAVSSEVHIDGEGFAKRDLSGLIPVYECDDYDNAEFEAGSFGMTAVSVKNGQKDARLVFCKSIMPEKAEKAYILLKSETEGRVDMIWNEKSISSWQGNTSSFDRALTVYELPTEHTIMEDHWTAKWQEIECALEDADFAAEGTLKLVISGDARVLSIKFR